MNNPPLTTRQIHIALREYHITTQELSENVFNAEYDMWDRDSTKDAIWDGINIKGISNMSREELIEQYQFCLESLEDIEQLN